MSSGGVWRPARRAEARTIQFAGDGVAMREEWQEAARARREEQREAAAQALAAPGNASSADVLRVTVSGRLFLQSLSFALGGRERAPKIWEVLDTPFI